MKKLLIILLLGSILSAIDIEKYQQNIVKDYKKYKRDMGDNTTTYITKTIYETNYQAKQLLDSAKFEKNPYPLIKKAFDIHNHMQENIFAIFDYKQQQRYIKEHKKYIYALFKTTHTYQDIQSTFNRWLNYKRTLFNRENILLSNKIMRAKKRIINKKRQELASAYQQKSIDKTKIKKLKQDIENFERSLSMDISTIPKSYINYQQISAILKPNELYIDFAKIENLYYLFILDSNNHIIFKRLNSTSIDSTIKNIQRENHKIIDGDFADLNIAKNLYGKLYNLIIKNIDLKNKNSLIISPDGLLNLIPFEAFYHNKKYLIENIDIHYTPSGKELLKLYYNKSLSSSQIIVFANPNFQTNQKSYKRGAIFEKLTPTFDSLDGSIIEANSIKHYFPNAKILYQKRASEKNLLNTISPKILHLSTHGFFIKDSSILNPMLKSGIVLSGANSSIINKSGDGIITALELSRLNLKGTKLVVLSACETGVGEIQEAQGVAGINRAFMSAGAKRVIMSLWSVSDMATSWLMKEFYKNLSKNMSYSSALANAKRSMIKNRNSHPYYWSGFIESGVD